MAGGHRRRPWPEATAEGHGRRPWPKAMAEGHWPKAMAEGHWRRPWPKTMTASHGRRPWPKAMAEGHGRRPWPKVAEGHGQRPCLDLIPDIEKHEILTQLILYKSYREILCQKVASGHLLPFLHKGSSQKLFKYVFVHNKISKSNIGKNTFINLIKTPSLLSPNGEPYVCVRRVQCDRQVHGGPLQLRALLRRSWPKAMAEGHDRRPWPKAMAEGHGRRPWPNAMAEGHDRRPWPKAMAEGHGRRPRPKAMAEGRRL